MDQTTNAYSLSPSSSSSSSSNNHPPKTTKSSRRSYTNSLHTIRKPTQKPIPKQFIAPLPPTPLKVYNIKPSNFKQVVRMLTSSPEFQSPPVRRLKDIAPPPLTLSAIPKPPLGLNETLDTNRVVSKPHEADYFENLSAPEPSFDPFGVAVMSPFGLNLSPSSLSWCSSVLLSPSNNLSGFNQSPIL